jgi:hypothetical protein
MFSDLDDSEVNYCSRGNSAARWDILRAHLPIRIPELRPTGTARIMRPQGRNIVIRERRISLLATLSLHPPRSGIDQLGSENSCDAAAKPIGEAIAPTETETAKETGAWAEICRWAVDLPLPAMASANIIRKQRAPCAKLQNRIELPSCQDYSDDGYQHREGSPAASRARPDRHRATPSSPTSWWNRRCV